MDLCFDADCSMNWSGPTSKWCLGCSGDMAANQLRWLIFWFEVERESFLLFSAPTCQFNPIHSRSIIAPFLSPSPASLALGGARDKCANS